MQYRPFGKTGLQVSEIGFGGSRLGGVFSQSKGKEEALRVLRSALDAGITLYDTADMYSQGESEALIGEAFRNQRDKVIIAGKAGYCLPTQRKLVARIKPLVRPVAQFLKIKRQNLPSGMSGVLSQDFSSAYLTSALEASLRRLKTDYLDVFQLHSPPAAVLAQGDFLETLEGFKKQGKIRRYGIAADSVEDALLCLRYDSLASLQFPFGLLDLEACDSLLKQAEAKGLGIIARGCFGGGLLKESLAEQELKEMTPKWPQILAFRQRAAQQKRPVLEMALQFSRHFPAVSTTLLGMRTEAHLATNLRYYAAAPLSPEEFAQLTS